MKSRPSDDNEFFLQRTDNGLEITLSVKVQSDSGYEGDNRGFDLVTRTIVSLIENLDTHLAEKEDKAWNTNHFYASILSAVARHSMVDNPFDEEATVQEVLQSMIDFMVSEGMLQETISSWSGEVDDE